MNCSFFFWFSFHIHIFHACCTDRIANIVCVSVCVFAHALACVYIACLPRARAHTHTNNAHTRLSTPLNSPTLNLQGKHMSISGLDSLTHFGIQHKTRKTGGGNAHGATPKYQSNRALNQDEYGTASCKLDILVPDVRYSTRSTHKVLHLNLLTQSCTLPEC